MTLAMVDEIVLIVTGRLKQAGDLVALSWGYSSEIVGFCGGWACGGDSWALLICASSNGGGVAFDAANDNKFYAGADLWELM
jgi:hypothetical protein